MDIDSIGGSVSRHLPTDAVSDLSNLFFLLASSLFGPRKPVKSPLTRP
jgi:hypothetical protein